MASLMKLALFALASLSLVTCATVSHDASEEKLMGIAAAVTLPTPPVHAPAPAPPPAHAPAPTPAPIIVKDAKECPGVCKGRCALHSRQNVCNRACITCCSHCKCVPPGTAGNRHTCGTCYTNWLTHRNQTKCP